jgi:hypothetical protein
VCSVCCVLFECGVLFCVLCLIVVSLPPCKTPFAVIIIIIIITILSEDRVRVLNLQTSVTRLDHFHLVFVVF